VLKHCVTAIVKGSQRTADLFTARFSPYGNTVELNLPNAEVKMKSFASIVSAAIVATAFSVQLSHAAPISFDGLSANRR
jgi:hypothetical protein